MSKSKRPKILPSPVVPKPIVETDGIKWGQLLAALVTAVAAFIGGQVSPNVLPVITVDPAPVVAVAPPEAWIPTDGTKRIDSPSLIAVASSMADGVYPITGVPKSGEAWVERVVTVATLNVPPKPVPVPMPSTTKPIEPTTPVPNSEITAAVYVYEKDDGEPPSSVRVALDRLNRERKILATTFEDDSTDGDGQVPDQYKAPLAAAKEYRLPVLVLMKQSGPPAVIQAPKTEQEVWEAVK